MNSDLLMKRRKNTLALCACILYLGTKITLLIPFVFFLFMDAILPMMQLRPAPENSSKELDD